MYALPIRPGTILRILFYGGFILGLFLLYSKTGIKPFVDAYARHQATNVEYIINWITPRKKLDQVRSGYRLKPDTRIIKAFTDISLLAGQNITTETKVKFTQDKWQIDLTNGNDSIYISELPSFAETQSLLRDHATDAIKAITWTDQPPQARIDAINKNINTFHPVRLHAILSSLDKLWAEGHHTPQIIKLSARAMARLSFISLDDVGVAGNVQAKALALVMLAQACTNDNMAFEESMIAQRMGYVSHAITLATSLSFDHPWRIYMENRNHRLFEESDNSPDINDVHYFALLRAAEINDKKQWYKLINRMYGQARLPIHVISTAYDLKSISYEKLVSFTMPHLILGELVSDVDATFMDSVLSTAASLPIENHPVEILINALYQYLNGEPEKFIDYFEVWVNKAGHKHNGLFLEEDDYKDFYRGYFFTALYRLGIYYVDLYNSIEKANLYAGFLEKSNSAIAAQFTVWFRHLINSEDGKPNLQKMMTDIDSMGYFGAAPLLRLLKEQVKYYNYGSPEIPLAITRLMKKMDSRPDHRHRLATLLFNNVLDFSKSEALYKSLRRDDPLNRDRLGAWLGRYYKDEDTIWSIVNNERVKPVDRIYSLELISDKSMIARKAGSAYQRIIESDPGNWDLRDKYIQFLEKQGFHNIAIHEAQDWLQSDNIELGSFDYLEAVSAISRLQTKMGRPDYAVAAAIPLVDSYYGYALRHAVDALLANGDLKEALNIAKKHHERYPNSLRSLMHVIKVHWLSGDYTAAATLLRQWRYKISHDKWRNIIAKTFFETFDQQYDAALEAYKTLIINNVSVLGLHEFGIIYARNKDYEFAFTLLSQLNVGGQSGMVINIRAYHYLKLANGQEPALKWLEARTPPHLRNMASMLYYNEVAYQLLWDLIPNPDNQEGAEYVWLMRAAAYIEGANLTEQQKNALLSYYNNADNRYYHLLGKYLLGSIDENLVFDTQMGPRKICETAYFIAIRKMVDGDYYAAADWFQVSLSTGSIKDGEYRWSYDRLYLWRKWARSLDILAEDKKLFRKEI